MLVRSARSLAPHARACAHSALQLDMGNDRMVLWAEQYMSDKLEYRSKDVFIAVKLAEALELSVVDSRNNGRSGRPVTGCVRDDPDSDGTPPRELTVAILQVGSPRAPGAPALAARHALDPRRTI